MTKIVVIEDDVEVLDNIVDTLEAAGYDVQSADRGQVGLEVAQKQLPDIIICDVTMPDMNGYEVLAEIRKHPEMATTPFIYLTARTERDEQRKGMELGADDYITKPYTQVELLAAIQTQLRKQDSFTEKFGSHLRVLRKNILYALPHELRTPLTLILGFAETLMTDHQTIDPATLNERATLIFNAAQRLYRVTENYLAYAQIEVIQSDPAQVAALRNHLTPNSAEIITRQAQAVAAKAERPQDLDLTLSNAALRISEENLAKITEELVDNAFKFSDPGTKVYLKAASSGDKYIVYLRDLGRGLTPEQIKNVDAYMQFERALHEQQGLGLGLILAKRLVEVHKGQFSIKSALGKGTLVTLVFPMT